LHRYLPDAPLPKAVRSTGRAPEFLSSTLDALPETVASAALRLSRDVEGTVGVIVPMSSLPGIADSAQWRAAFQAAGLPDRVQILGSLEAKGLEFDAVVLADPDLIASESPMGPRTHYVAVTRATQVLITVTVAQP
jgi:DNA helicase IV